MRCAISVLLEKPSLISKIFVTKDYRTNGLYKLNLFKKGLPIQVTVDDFIPCSIVSEQPLGLQLR